MEDGVGSGCLINNTSQNFTPYILTARHNFFDDSNSGSSPNRNIGTAIFTFHYLRQNCGSGTPANARSITGATLRAQHRPTDVLLVQLNSTIPSSYDVYFAGWDRATTGATTATGLHHPSGDAMKISQARSTATAVSYIESPYWTDVTLNHWRVTFDDGIVQYGSSVSPLFNQNRRIVGQLHENQNNTCISTDNTCYCRQTPVGEYGKFDLSWTGGLLNSTRLSNWLDLAGTNPAFLNGNAPVSISGPTQICVGSPQSFTAFGWQAGYSWDKSPGLSLSSTTSNPTTLSAIYNGIGWKSVKNSGGTELARKTIEVGPPYKYISGNAYPCVGAGESYQMHSISNTAAATSYEWWDGVNVDSYFATPWWGEYCGVIMGNNPFRLYARACNDCGCSDTYIDIYPQ